MKGPLTKEELVQIYSTKINQAHNDRNAVEKDPKKLVGNYAPPKGFTPKIPIKVSKKKSEFEMDYKGTVKGKAMKIVEFLAYEGVLRKVQNNFPSERKPDARELEKSNRFLDIEVRGKVLEALGYKIPKN